MCQETINYKTKVNYPFIDNNPLLKCYPTVVDVVHPPHYIKKTFTALSILNNSGNKICIPENTLLESCKEINSNHEQYQQNYLNT